MKVKMIDFGGKTPERAHYNDAGLDCFATRQMTIDPNFRAKVPLGFGLELPDGYVAFLLPRSSLNSRGVRVEIGTIDSGYRGEIQAVVHNAMAVPFTIEPNMKIAQLVVMPVTYIEPTIEEFQQRLDGGFGSSGK